MRFLSLFALVLLCSTEAFAQRNFTPLESSGPIPAEFRTILLDRIHRSQEDLKRSYSEYADNPRINESILINDFVIDRLLNGGNVLFGDSLTQYVNKVADVLLKEEPELKDELRFYVLQSPDLNAFTTSHGIIVITVGLLSRIENEAQLAFVLSHEIAHYARKHAFEKLVFKETKRLDVNKERIFKRDERVKLLSEFSKEMEFQSDSLGFLRFTKAGYNPEAALSIMDLLYRASIRVMDHPFDPSFLELDSLEFPSSLTLTSLKEIPLPGSNEEEEKNSSHPDIEKRKAKLGDMLKGLKIPGNSNFIVDKNEFRKIQYLAQRQMIVLQLRDGQYVDALYDTHVLLQQYPGERFLEESAGKSLYGLSKYLNAGNSRYFDLYSDQVYGHRQALHYFVRELSRNQVNMIAVRYLLYLDGKYHTPFIHQLLYDLAYEGMKENELNPSELAHGLANSKKLHGEWKMALAQEAIIVDSLEVVASEEVKSDSVLKDDQTVIITKDENESHATIKKEWDKYFHYRAIGEEARQKLIDEVLPAAKRRIADDDSIKYNVEAPHKKEEKLLRRRGYALGIDSVIFVDPFYYSVDRQGDLKVLLSEDKRAEFMEILDTCSKIANIQTLIVTGKKLDEAETARFNDVAMIRRWSMEFLEHSLSEVEMIPLSSEYTRDIEGMMENRYLCYVGVLQSPQGLKRKTDVYLICFDVVNGKEVWATRSKVRRQNKAQMNSIVYDLLYQLKNERN